MAVKMLIARNWKDDMPPIKKNRNTEQGGDSKAAFRLPVMCNLETLDHCYGFKISQEIYLTV